MNIYTFCIAARQTDVECPEGYVRAASLREAIKIIGNEEANVYTVAGDVEWPGAMDQKIVWTRNECKAWKPKKS